MASCIANRAAVYFSPNISCAPCNSIQSATYKFALCRPTSNCSTALFTFRTSAAVTHNFPAQPDKYWLGSAASTFTAPTLLSASTADIRATRSFCRGQPVDCRAGGILEEVKKKNEENAVVVYSKTYCPYCSQVKSLFKELKVDYKLIELNELREEEDVQDALYELTRQTTVPNVFIGGKHIGGCDDTMALKRSGKLSKLLADAGVNVSSK